MDAVELVAAVSTPPCATDFYEVPKEISWLQIRSDLIGDVPADWLRSQFHGRLLYTLRTSSSGGKFDRSIAERQQRLGTAATDYDLVELEAPGDLRPELLDCIPPAKRMIVWRGTAAGVDQLASEFRQLSGIPARYYCMVLDAARTSDGLRPLSLLKTLNRRDVAAYCDGPYGLWSQLLSPNLGSPLLFGHFHNSTRKSGELSVQQLLTDYGFPFVRPLENLYGMVGNRIFQSPSPRLHNCAYRSLDHPALFLPFYSENFEEFWNEMVQSRALDALGIPLQGLVVVSPFKEAAVVVAQSSSSMVSKAHSTNVFVRRNEAWQAETTDPDSIAAIGDASRIRAAVIGCGGAGRAVAAALQQSGSDVTLVNRSSERGNHATELLGLPFVPLSEFSAHGFDLIVNATPVGKENDGFPFVIDSLGHRTIVVDLAYGSQPTPLVSAVRARGGVVVDGYDVLVTQVRKQFWLMTGLEMPAGICRDTISTIGNGNRLGRGPAFPPAPDVPETFEYTF